MTVCQLGPNETLIFHRLSTRPDCCEEQLCFLFKNLEELHFYFSVLKYRPGPKVAQITPHTPIKHVSISFRKQVCFHAALLQLEYMNSLSQLVPKFLNCILKYKRMGNAENNYKQ